MARKKRGSSVMCEKVRKHTRAGKKIKSYGRKRKENMSQHELHVILEFFMRF